MILQNHIFVTDIRLSTGDRQKICYICAQWAFCKYDFEVNAIQIETNLIAPDPEKLFYIRDLKSQARLQVSRRQRIVFHAKPTALELGRVQSSLEALYFTHIVLLAGSGLRTL